MINPDSTYKVSIDGKEAVAGALTSETNFEPPLNPPARIVDPEDRKPADWVDFPEVGLSSRCPIVESIYSPSDG